MKRPGICVALVAALFAAVLVGLPSSVGAATFTVTSGNNSGTGSLRQAVIDAAASPGPDTISITPQLLINVSGGTIVYNASGVSNTLTIEGNNAVVDGTGGTTGIFEISQATSGNVSFTNLTLQNGMNTTGTRSGGAVHARNTAGTVSFTNVVFANNHSYFDGGAIDFCASISVTASTFRGNLAQNGDGGAIDDSCSAQGVINYSTFAGNVAGDQGGAVSAQGGYSMTNVTVTGNAANYGGGLSNGSGGAGTTTLRYATVVGNEAGTAGANVEFRGIDAGGSIIASPAGGASNCKVTSPLTSAGYNFRPAGATSASCGLNAGTDIAGADPRLGPLQDNGGPPVLTMIPEVGSPVIHAATTCFTAAATTDERSFARPATNCTVGAVEPISVTKRAAGGSLVSGGHARFDIALNYNAAGIATGKLRITDSPSAQFEPGTTILTPTGNSVGLFSCNGAVCLNTGATTTGLKYTFAVDVVVAAGAVTGQSATNTVNVHQDFGAGFQQIATDSDSVTLGLVVAKAVTASALPGGTASFSGSIQVASDIAVNRATVTDLPGNNLVPSGATLTAIGNSVGVFTCSGARCTNTLGGLSSGTTYQFAATSQIDSSASVGDTAVNSLSASMSSPSFAQVASTSFMVGPAPTIASVSPNSGSTSGGTQITIKGGNFTAGSTVLVGGNACTNVSVVDSSTITCDTPTGAVGPVDVAVTTADGTATAPAAFTYAVPPTTTGLTPSMGPTGGGTTLVITGTNFVPGASVSVGNASCLNVAVLDLNTITCVTPPGAAGAVNVTVTTPAGTTAPESFTYVLAPTITGVSPPSGPFAGGTQIAIAGADFSGLEGVTVGGTNCLNILLLSPSLIQCVTPPGTVGAQDVVVDTAGGTTANPGTFTYLAAPTLVGISPSSGPVGGGTQISLTGTNFLAGATVSVGGSPCLNVSVLNDTTITCDTPAGTSGDVGVTVTTPGGTTSPQTFTYQDLPTVTAVAPASGPVAGGTEITITGTNFDGVTGVTVGGAPCTSIVIDGPTSLRCVTPARTSGERDVVVTNADGPAPTPGTYTYLDPPTAMEIAPGIGPANGGTAVTITGTNFVSGSTVLIGGNPCTNVVVVNVTTITCAAPPGAAGAADVSVTTPGGTASSLEFIYTVPPTIAGVAPSSGPSAGGTQITITGSNFDGSTTVLIGGNPCTSVVIATPTTITCTTPAGSAGPNDVTVTTVGGSATLPGGFTMLGAPFVEVSPNAGPATGGTTININAIGVNFVSGTTVELDGATCTDITIVNSTKISCRTPAGTPGPADVKVTVPGPFEYVTPGGYTYLTPPAITLVTPDTGSQAGGTPILIQGSRFSDVTTVTVGGAPCRSFTVTSQDEIECVTPAGALGPADVRVTTSSHGDATKSGSFTYIVRDITGVSPEVGTTEGGTPIVIDGAGFGDDSTVTVGGSACTTVNVVSATRITCTTPSHSPGAVAVVVTTGGDVITQSAAFTYIVRAISGVVPDTGNVDGGTVITIEGQGFGHDSTVLVGGNPCTNVTVESATKIICTAPAHAAGAVDVAISTGGDTIRLADAFTYAIAGITVVGPDSGSVAGGTRIRVEGWGFTDPTLMTVGGVACTDLIIESPTVLTCTTGPAALGSADVVLTTGGQSFTIADAFTYLSPAVSEKLPLNVSGPRSKKKPLPGTGKTVVVKRSSTSAAGTVKVKVRAVSTSQTRGDMGGWTYKVSKSGKITVTTFGVRKLKLTVTIQAVPKPGVNLQPSRVWTRSWKVT